MTNSNTYDEALAAADADKIWRHADISRCRVGDRIIFDIDTRFSEGVRHEGVLEGFGASGGRVTVTLSYKARSHGGLGPVKTVRKEFPLSDLGGIVVWGDRAYAQERGGR